MIRTAKQAGLEWEGAGLPEAPSAPDSLQESGLPLGFLNDLLLRVLYTRGSMVGLDLARFLCLPFKVIEEPLRLVARTRERIGQLARGPHDAHALAAAAGRGLDQHRKPQPLGLFRQ